MILGIPQISLKLLSINTQFKIKNLNQTININNTDLSHANFDFKQPSFTQYFISHTPNPTFLPDNAFLTSTTHPLIFTDGSKMVSGTAFAFVVQHQNTFTHTETYKLTINHSIFQAELLAINAALDWAVSTHFNEFTILTDSKSSTLSIQQFYPDNSSIQTKIKHFKNKTFNI